MRVVQCFSCKDFGHSARDCPKKFCNYCKKQGHIISVCPIRPERKQGTAYHASTGASSSTALLVVYSVVPIPAPTALANPNTLTPEMVQQMIISVFSTLDSQDQVSGKMIAKGPKVGQLFPLHVSPSTIIPSFHLLSFACNVVGSRHKMWHRRLGHLNSDGIAPIVSHAHYKYFVTFIDDFSRFTWVYFLRAKVEVFSVFKRFLALIETQFSTSIKVLRSDSGGEYMSNEFHDFLQSKGIISQHSFPSTPQQNGVVERKNRHLLDVNVIFLENQYFFPYHVEPPFASVSLLPSFFESPTIVEGFKPVFGYERRSRHESNSTSSMPPSNLDPTLDPAPASTTLHQSTRLSRPPDWYGFFSPVSLVATLSTIYIPSCYKQAMEHECWQNAMQAELQALEENHTWDIVPCPPIDKPIGSKWVFSVKLRSNGSLDQHKACLVALGNKQEYGVDYEETFTPVAKMTMVRTILVITASQSWKLHQMDVKNGFLHGDLQEEIYMKLPFGMTNSSPHDVCKLKRSLYGLKQAPRAWFEKFRSTILSFSFTQIQYDYSLFFHTSAIVLLLVYVDDIIITGTNCSLITKLQQLLHATFHMKDLGQLTYFLGLEVHHRASGIFVNQHKYIQDLITLAGLEDTSSVDTPMEVNVKCRKDEGDLLDDPTLYRLLVGSLIYLTTTRPDISYAVHLVNQFMTSPRHLHLSAVHRIICYL
ncbi:Retrovirus-related Pol polyprotein from transposon RE1 [Vitis vinifera]|uniref:Retrovirus-related Pol polyprotein from transposon RE1 n=1 Tax=Vitis vinifera TaxID=29760 RepID=A0A438HJY8_VITVI|nr:Retrovirus-related Pol polyprotein from transposon RE1 [Vitis vinifera]